MTLLVTVTTINEWSIYLRFLNQRVFLLLLVIWSVAVETGRTCIKGKCHLTCCIVTAPERVETQYQYTKILGDIETSNLFILRSSKCPPLYFIHMKCYIYWRYFSALWAEFAVEKHTFLEFTRSNEVPK